MLSAPACDGRTCMAVESTSSSRVARGGVVGMSQACRGIRLYVTPAHATDRKGPMTIRVRGCGPIVFESFSSAVVSPALSNTLGVWRNLWEDSADLAAHAQRTIRDSLRAVETLSLH